MNSFATDVDRYPYAGDSDRDETIRLSVLKQCGILDTPAEAGFDALAALAATVCDAPVALIGLMDRERQWFKAVFGLDGLRQIARDQTFCRQTLRQKTLTEIEDIGRDARCAGYPLVTGAPYARFYAGAPLLTADGHALGTVFVIDRRPRRLSAAQRRALSGVATAAAALLDDRRRAAAGPPPGAAGDASLRASEQRFRDCAAAGSDWFWETDADGRFCWFSEGVEERSGLQVEALLGKTREELGLIETAPPPVEPDQNQTRKPFRDVELRFDFATDAGQKSLWIRSSGVPVFDQNGRFYGYRGVTSDISKLKKAERERRYLQQQLVRTSRLAGQAEVAAGVLHSVGNVLNSVNVSLSMLEEQLSHSRLGGLGQTVALLDQHDDRLGDFFTNHPKGRQLPVYLNRLHAALATERAQQGEEVALMRSGMSHLNRILATYQHLAKPIRVTEPAVLGDLLDEVLALTVDDDSGIVVERDYRFSDPVSIDRYTVLQILTSLVRNARRALLDNATPAPKIVARVESTLDRKVWQISIADNGPGIAAAQQSAVFSFDPAAGETGNGYGLHASATQAQSMGGALRCDSDGAGRGATFTLICPQLKPD